MARPTAKSQEQGRFHRRGRIVAGHFSRQPPTLSALLASRRRRPYCSETSETIINATRRPSYWCERQQEGQVAGVASGARARSGILRCQHDLTAPRLPCRSQPEVGENRELLSGGIPRRRLASRSVSAEQRQIGTVGKFAVALPIRDLAEDACFEQLANQR